MKIQVLHDNAGAIRAVFAPSGTSRQGGIEAPDAETTVIESDVQEVAPASDAVNTDPVTATIGHVMEHYEVRDGRLVERAEK
jgi:hypothetical protein